MKLSGVSSFFFSFENARKTCKLNLVLVRKSKALYYEFE